MNLTIEDIKCRKLDQVKPILPSTCSRGMRGVGLQVSTATVEEFGELD